MLTPEQVAKCALSVYYEGYNDGSLHRGQGVNEIDWPTITDKLNAELRSSLNPDGLPSGLVISDNGLLLNWRGENYVKQSTLGRGVK